MEEIKYINGRALCDTKSREKIEELEKELAVKIHAIDVPVDLESDTTATLDISYLDAKVGEFVIDKEESLWKIDAIESDIMYSLSLYETTQTARNTKEIRQLKEDKVDKTEFDELKGTIEDLEIGGGTVVSSIEPMEDDIPKVFFEGDITGMTKDNEKVLNFAYKSKTKQFDGYVKMKWQGSSSLDFPKKNFTIKMFSDESCETKLKKTFKDWKHEGNKYVLKANYIDHTHARNVVTANLWAEIVASRSDYESLPSGLKNSPKNGAIDGFPIKLYMNGKYEGIYTWNIGKDDWMFGVDEDNVNQAVICAEKNNNGNSSTTDRNILACEFRANANIDGNDWDLEVPSVLQNNIKTSFNNLINCVKDTDDTTFKATIGNYLDITSAIDYYILMYFSCAVDNLGKNLIMVTYDGVKWYCSAYDLDNIWGSRGTNTFVDGTFQCPEQYQDTNSLLWQRIEKCFSTELYERYQTIRKHVLSFSNVIDKFERFCDLIGTELYSEDVTIYSGIPYPNENNLKQIRNFFTPRAKYVDSCFEEFKSTNEDNPSNEVTLSSISATYSGGEVEVGSDITELASNLVVKANYSDGTSQTVTGYEMSGEIIEGSNTITITYQGKSTTFTVVGYVEELPVGVLYQLQRETTFNGTDTYIDTGIKLWSQDIDFTIAIDMTPSTNTGERTVFACTHHVNPYQGMVMSCHPTNTGFYKLITYDTNGGQPSVTNTNIPYDTTKNVKVVITHVASSGLYNLHYMFDGSTYNEQHNDGFKTNDISIVIGASDVFDSTSTPLRVFNGTIHDFKIYSTVLTDDKITAYFNS